MFVILVQALALLGQAASVTAAPPTPTHLTPLPITTTQIRAPEPFNGSNPDDLWPFLLQCQLTFGSYPQQYAADTAKVFFAISYLKKSALEWFEHGIMETDVTLAPMWRSSWPHFVNELRTYFGPANPIGDAEAELRQLFMNTNSRLTEYLICFNTLAARVDWGDSALHYQFYDGLPDRIKDRISMQGKLDNLREMVELANRADILHWERQAEQKTSCRYQPARYAPRLGLIGSQVRCQVPV